MDNLPILRLENVSKFYKSANNVALGIRKVNVSFNMGEFVVITGASGSGKSTLLNVLSGMTSYEEGIMYINGEDTSYYGHEEYENYRRDYISCIFQNYNIIDSYSVYENIELALIAKGVKKEDRKPVVLEVAKKVGLTNRLRNKVTRLSGGEKQRVAIARALVSDAPILVCDEITGNLDHDTSIEIIELLHSVSEGKLVLMVTHDPEEVEKYATRVISMHDGEIESDRILKQVNVNEEVRIKKTCPIAKKEIFKLALKSYKNTPKKSILLTMIILLATIFIGFACASIGVETSNYFGYDGGYYSYSSYNRYNGNRVIVVRKDGNMLSDTDYSYFNSLSQTKTLIKNDPTIDYQLYVSRYDIDAEGWEYSSFYESTFVMPISLIKQSDLVDGRLPSNNNEVVIQCSDYERVRSVLNQEVNINGGYSSQLGFKATVCGYMSNAKQESVLYVTDELFNYISTFATFDYLSIYTNKNMDIGYLINASFKYVVVDNTLPANTLNIYSCYSFFDETPVVSDTTITIYWNTLHGEQKIENINMTFNLYDKLGDLYTAANLPNDYIDFGTDWCGVVKMSEDIYDQIIDTTTYQASIITENNKDAKEICKTLINNDYVAVQYYYEKTEDSDTILGVIIGAFLTVYCVILTLIIYLLANLSLKNVIYSERKDLLIMRSLGINSKDVTKQIYIKLVGVGLVTCVLFTIFVIVMHTMYFPSYNLFYSISKMRVIEVIYTYVLMFSLTYLLAHKFASNIFNANIASKEKEDTVK